MENEIVYVCNSINNKNVRGGELEILRIHKDQLYFEFGENEMNIKKRFYNDLKTLNKDFDALLKLKNKQSEERKIIKEERKSVKEKDFFEIEDLGNKKKFNKKNSKLF